MKIDLPLLDTQEVIRLSQFAQEFDYEDVRLLFNAEREKKKSNIANQVETQQNDHESDDVRLKTILSEINSDNLTAKFGIPIDSARASYIMDCVTIDSFDDFNATITSFYTHLLRHMGGISESIDISKASAENPVNKRIIVTIIEVIFFTLTPPIHLFHKYINIFIITSFT